MMRFSPDDVLRAAHGERVPGLTHARVDGMPLGPGPPTPVGWRVFDAARQDGFLTTPDSAEQRGTLHHVWRRWCAAHDLPEVTVSPRQLGRLARQRAGPAAPDRVADAQLTFDPARRVLSTAGLLTVAEALVWAGGDGEGTVCRWFTSPSLVRIDGVPVETAAELGAVLLRIGQDVRLTRPGPFADQDADVLREIGERRHGG